MKHKIFILMAAALGALSSCSDDSFTCLYEDPGKTTTVSSDKLMTGVFYSTRQYMYNAYWRMYTWDYIFGRYAQTIGYANNSGWVYSYNDGYAFDRWDNFYQALAQFRQLENHYATESEASQATDRIYKDLAEVVVYDNLAQITSIFGNVPFTRAGYLGVDGSVTSARVPFDNDEELYQTMLTRLGELYNDIAEVKANTPAMVTKNLAAQDFVNDGDLTKWLTYANSLRLRIAVQLASQGSLTSQARSAITECLSRQLVTNDNAAIEVAGNNQDDQLFNSDDAATSFKDVNNVASQPMIDAMTRVSGQQDYRLKVMYSPNKDGNFIGTNRSESNEEQTKNGSAFNGFGNGLWKDRYYAYLDSATFTGNRLLISPIVSAAEVDFLRAECFQQGWAQGDAKAAFVDGMINSTRFYYRQNNAFRSDYGYVGTYPGDEAVRAYAEKLWDSYTDKEEAIITQKWVHFGIMQAPLAWNDIRRTGYPKLTYPTDEQAQTLKNLPTRIKYPNKEKANNAKNYADATAVQADDWVTKLFWAK